MGFARFGGSPFAFEGHEQVNLIPQNAPITADTAFCEKIGPGDFDGALDDGQGLAGKAEVG